MHGCPVALALLSEKTNLQHDLIATILIHWLPVANLQGTTRL